MRASWDGLAAVAFALALLSFSVPVPVQASPEAPSQAAPIVHVEHGTETVVATQAQTQAQTQPHEATTVSAGVASTTVVAATGACAPAPTGTTGSAPALSRDNGAIVGTSSEDLAEFASAFNDVRVAHCLTPIPVANFRFGACMEKRLVWMAEDPSTDPASAWGHEGSVRSDGVPSVGCDGNLAGGSDNTGATVAQKWWDSLAHRASLYRPDDTSDVAHVCIDFAMTHGGIPNEPLAFTRAAARWVAC